MSPVLYTVDQADLSRDRERIIDLWRQNYDAIPPNRYDWMYQNNPLGDPYCLLLKTPDGEIVGATALMRRRVRLGPRSLCAGQAIDLVVHRAHRSGGPALQLQRALLAGLDSHHIDLLYSTPLPGAELIARRVGYRILSPLQRWSAILRSEAELRTRIPMRALRIPAGILIDAALRIRSGDLLFRETRWNTGLCDGFDARFDDLWARASKRFEWIGERSASYLAWRFGQNAGHFQIFSITDHKQCLMGYLVFSQYEQTARIADLLVADPAWLAPLLRAFSRSMRKAGLAYLNLLTVGPAWLGKTLLACGFFRRPEKSNMLMFISETRLQEFPQILDASHWYLTDADRDV